MVKHIIFCRRQSLLVRYMKQKNCSAHLDLLLSKFFLNHSVAPRFINIFSHPGVYILLVAEWVSLSHCPSSEAAHPWSFLSYCSFQSLMCSVGLLWTPVPVILLECDTCKQMWFYWSCLPAEGTGGLWFLPAHSHSGFALWAAALDSSLSHRM